MQSVLVLLLALLACGFGGKIDDPSFKDELGEWVFNIKGAALPCRNPPVMGVDGASKLYLARTHIGSDIYPTTVKVNAGTGAITEAVYVKNGDVREVIVSESYEVLCSTFKPVGWALADIEFGTMPNNAFAAGTDTQLDKLYVCRDLVSVDGVSYTGLGWIGATLGICSYSRGPGQLNTMNQNVEILITL